jgi:hypothetical protein
MEKYFRSLDSERLGHSGAYSIRIVSPGHCNHLVLESGVDHRCVNPDLLKRAECASSLFLRAVEILLKLLLKRDYLKLGNYSRIDADIGRLPTTQKKRRLE